MLLPLKFPLSPAMFLSDMFHNERRRWQVGGPWEKFRKGLSILYSSGSHRFLDTENSCPEIQHKSLKYLTISSFRSLTLGRKLYSYLVCHAFLWKARLDCLEELYSSLPSVLWAVSFYCPSS